MPRQPITTEPLARGEAEVLGIYGGQARGNVPQAEFECDINQIPSMFFDYKCIETGQVTFGVFIDKVNTGNVGASHMGEKDAVLPFNFGIPIKVKKPGNHSVEVKTGHTETKPDKTVWDKTDVFSMTLTGKLRQDD